MILSDSLRLPKASMKQQFRQFEAFDLPFLVVDSDEAPQYLSQTAAKLFRLRYRQDLEDFQELFADLTSLVRQVPRNIGNHQLGVRQSPIREFELQTLDRRRFPALAYAQAIQQGTCGFMEEEYYLVLIRSLQNLVPWFQLAEQYRSIRPRIIRALSTEGGASDNPSSSLSTNRENNCDVLDGITKGIDLADDVFPTSFKISVDSVSPALLGMSEASFLQLFLHLLFECSDYAALRGDVRIHGNILRDTPKGSSRLYITANREQSNYDAQDPLDRYLIQRLTPQRFQVGARELNESNGEPARELDEGSYSVNMQQASSLALGLGAKLSLKLPEPSSLCIQLLCPLA